MASPKAWQNGQNNSQTKYAVARILVPCCGARPACRGGTRTPPCWLVRQEGPHEIARDHVRVIVCRHQWRVGGTAKLSIFGRQSLRRGGGNWARESLVPRLPAGRPHP